MNRSLWRTAVLTGAIVLGAAACNSDRLNVPDFNRPTVDGASKDPAAVLQLLATGVLLTERNDYAGYISDVGVFGRESYNYFPTDARTVSHYLIGQPGPNSTRVLDPTGFASGQWNGQYGNMKNATNMIAIVNSSSLPADQKNAALGFARTFYALALYEVAVTRDSLGAPIKITDDPASPAPWATRDEVWGYISALLDSAATDLAAGGTAFPFTLHSGFDDFDTPATFRTFNRALAARILVNRGSLGCASCYGDALTALGQSFLTAPATIADLNLGPAHIYSGAAGDALNGLNSVANTNRFAHASLWNDAQLQADGVTKDARAERKLVHLATPTPAPGSGNGIPAEYRFQMYPTTTSPTPIIRDEELLLLRAEARMQTNDLAGALADINTIRTISGNMPALASLGADANARITTLLYEREMSLMWEGHRWNDVRRYKRLSTLPLDQTNHFRAIVMPIPKTECDARPSNLRPAEGC